ncbi:MAG: hypothetical protein ACC652_04075, partial [Acidimicrobiales bacterium]
RAAADSMSQVLEADELVLSSLALGPEGRAAIDASQGVLPSSYPRRQDVDPDDFAELYGLTVDRLVDRALSQLGGARYLAVKSYFVDRRLELISHILGIHPEQVIELRDEAGLRRPEQGAQRADQILSYLVGAAIGRWDIRVFEDPSLASPLPDLFDPVSLTPPGMLTGNDGLPLSEAPEGYPLRLPPDWIMHDDAGHPWDLARAVESVAEVIFDDGEQELRELLRHSRANDLRWYLRTKFPSAHLSRYSKSRRKAPIYWFLAVPSKQWGLWVYAPQLSREQLFAVAGAAQEKMRRLADEAGQLRRDLEAGAGREVRERLETAEELSREVAVFHEKAEAVARSGWEPDLNDGIILNAGPFEELFADAKWRKDVAKHRVKMQNGDYQWATVQTTYYDQMNP